MAELYVLLVIIFGDINKEKDFVKIKNIRKTSD